MSAEQCDKIHDASLEILRRTGVRIYHDEALALLRQTGAVRIEENRVWFQPGLVEWAIENAPSRVPLCLRGSDTVIAPLERKVVSFGTGSDTTTFLDPRTCMRRSFSTDDLADCARVVDAMPELQFCMSHGIPMDIGPNPYRDQFAIMIKNTSKPIVFVCNDRPDCEAITAMATAAAGGITELRLNPTLLLYSEPSSPLRHSKTAVEKLLYMADQSLPVVHSPAPVQGGTAPVTLSGALAMANAEILSGLTIHQLKRSGAPFVYGSGMHHLDMITMASVYTCPEFVLARTAVAQMGRHYGIPTWGYAGDVNSCVVDEQASAEGTFSILASLLAGTNLTHDVGYLESGLTFSPEMVVLCDEIISMLRRYMAGISFDENSMAMDAIHDVGSDGNYLEHDHTIDNFRQLWRPSLFNRFTGEAWTRAGGKRLGEVIREKTISIMDNHTPEPLTDTVLEEIDYIMRNG